MRKKIRIKLVAMTSVFVVIVASIVSIGIGQARRYDESLNAYRSGKQAMSLEEILDEANEIELEKKFFSFRKHYYVSVGDNIVGEVVGKYVPMFGDVLELRDLSGKLVKKEYQVKRLGVTHTKLFNISFDRLAEVRDAKDNVTGYIGEDKIGDLFNLKHTQHFFDKDGKELGEAKPKHLVLSKDYKVTDSKGKVEYTVDGNIFSILSKSTMTKHGEPGIGEEDAIFYTIIENAIYDSKSSSSEASTKK